MSSHAGARVPILTGFADKYPIVRCDQGHRPGGFAAARHDDARAQAGNPTNRYRTDREFSSAHHDVSLRKAK